MIKWRRDSDYSLKSDCSMYIIVKTVNNEKTRYTPYIGGVMQDYEKDAKAAQAVCQIHKAEQ